MYKNIPSIFSIKSFLYSAIYTFSLHDDTEPEEFKIIIDALRNTCGT